MRNLVRRSAMCLLLSSAPALLNAQTPVLQIKAGEVAARVSPMLYGLMTEEINYSYDGGLYGELIRNRNFKEDAKESVHWALVQEHGGTGSALGGQPARHLDRQRGYGLVRLRLSVPAHLEQPARRQPQGH